MGVFFLISPGRSIPDRYAKFFYLNDQLLVEHGVRNPRAAMRTELLAQNVSSCKFSGAGTSLKMSLELDNGREIIKVVTSAVLHN